MHMSLGATSYGGFRELQTTSFQALHGSAGSGPAHPCASQEPSVMRSKTTAVVTRVLDFQGHLSIPCTPYGQLALKLLSTGAEQKR
eukprot:2133764-Amphidinium_carterae.1